MAKAKTKPVPFGKTATETEYGTWEWGCGGFTWWWKPGMGLNFGTKHNDELQPLLCVKTLNEAGIFAEGFQAGLEHARRTRDVDTQ